MTIEQQIELLESQIQKLDNSGFDLPAWKSASQLLLSRVFENDYLGIANIEKIKLRTSGMKVNGVGSFTNNMKSCKQQGREIIQAGIDELRTFGPRESQQSKSGININLTQNQTVNVNLIISALEDELTVSQFNELKEIANGNEAKSEKKKRLTQKLIDSGVDITAKVLSNILTNPAIWG